MKNTLLQKVLNIFSDALRAEIENGIGNERSILAYYKCIELISQNETKLSRADKSTRISKYKKLTQEVTKDIKKRNSSYRQITLSSPHFLRQLFLNVFV